MDDLIPEFEARYDADPADKGTDADADRDRSPSGEKTTVCLSVTYPVLQEFSQDSLLIERNGVLGVLKFGGSDSIPDEAFFRKLKALGERLRTHVIGIQEHGFDENTKRWYVIEEYARYGSLKDLAEVNSDPRLLNTVLKGIIEGLKALHENNVFHLHLRPSAILLRETSPPQPAFSGFSLSSFSGPTCREKTTPAAGGLRYAPPELSAGVVGPKANYWFLGTMLRELFLRGHPPAGAEDNSMTDSVASRSGLIPEHISEGDKVLLRGLLTDDPGKRWGYAEVKRWLAQDTNIPACYSEARENGEKVAERRPAAYKFLNREYSSFKELIAAFLKGEEAWGAAKDLLVRNIFSVWLHENSDEKTGAMVDSIMEQAAGDPDLAMIILIYTFYRDLPFILYGKLITPKNLYIFAGRVLRHENSAGEEAIIDSLLGGKIIDYYRECLMLTARAEDELSGLFEAVLKATAKREKHADKLSALFKLLDILANPSSYMLPPKIADNLMGNLHSLGDNIDGVMTRDSYNEMIGTLIIPEEMRETLADASPEGLRAVYSDMKRPGGTFLTRDEFSKLEDEYVVPRWLEDGLLGKEAAAYAAALKLLRELRAGGLLARKSDFLEYLRKHIQFIGYVIDKTATSQQGRKGESSDQKWLRLLKSDIGRDGYLKVAKHVKNNVMLPMFSRIDEITRKVSSQADASDSLRRVIGYLEALRSGEVPWDESDRQLINEIHSFVGKKENASLRLIEKSADGAFGRFFRGFLKVALRIDPDERTRETESGFAGLLGGACFGVIAWIIIANLGLETSFYGPVVAGLLSGLVMKSVVLALLFAAAGFAGAFFLGAETLMEGIFAFLLSITGGTRIGAFIGKRTGKYSFYDGILIRYQSRINAVLDAAETDNNY
jgi:serine/threonine protein kinase